MQIKRKTASSQKLILAGMITDTTVLSRIASQWPREGLFDDPDANRIGSWCVRFYEKYKISPNGRIQSIFESWSEKETTKQETAELVEKKLFAISSEIDSKPNVASDYVLDRAGRYFEKVRLQQAIRDAEVDLEGGDVDKAWDRFRDSKKLELGEGSVIKLEQDFLAWRQALDEERERSLLAYPGRLKGFFGDMLCRDSFIVFTGKTGAFKSFWILDAAFRALRNRHRVAMFQIGDMSQDQIMRRLAVRFARRPIEPKTFKIPRHFPADEEESIKYESRTVSKRLTPQEVYRYVRKATRGRDLFRLSCFPNDSVDVFGLQSVIDRWDSENWIPDVVLLDYADLLSPPKGITEKRHQIDTTWKRMKKLNMELHCLFLTGTQSDAVSYTQKGPMGRWNFSDSRTKNDHVNGNIGLNVTADNQERCVTGLNWIKKREEKNNEKRQLFVAGCLDIANPAMICQEKKTKESR